MKRHTFARAFSGTLVAVALVTSAACGGGDDHKKNDRRNAAPAAEFTVSTARSLVPMTVQFDASSSHDTDGTLTSYAWTFGDGGTGTGVVVQHTFTAVGRYAVELTVKDGEGATGTAGQAIVAMSPVAASHYAVAEIPTLGGWYIEPVAINNLGHVTGWGYAGDDEASHVFLYANGTTRDLGTVRDNAFARDLNDADEIVGVANFDGPGAPSAFVWRDGVMRDLGNLGGYGAEANGINGVGQIVGRAEEPDGDVRAFLYENGVMHVVDVTTADYAYAESIADDGSIAGALSTPTGVHPFLHEAGTTTDLGTLGGHSGYPVAHNSAGDVVGYSVRSDGVYDGFLYRDGVMGRVALGLTEPLSINEAGVVVGRDLYGTAVVWDGVNGEQALEALTPADESHRIDFVADINDIGQIVARGTRLADDATVLLILTPVDD